jgi:hypothetical protein
MSAAREAKPSKARMARRRAIDARPTYNLFVQHRWRKEAEE